MPTYAADETDSGIEEVVVTAQFRRQNLQETPIAITAMTGGMLESRSQTNISEVANQAPSVTLKANSASYGPSLAANIRGVGQFDFHPALEPGVGLYVDDVYFATLTGSILDLLDLDRVELLRGPQGTLAGKNSIGGAVKLYSKKPTGDDTGYGSVTYGSRSRLDLRGGFDVGLTSDLFARFAAVSRAQDGYVSRVDYGCANPGQGIPATMDSPNCTLSRQGEVNYQAFRGQLRYVPNDALEINLAGDYTRENHAIAGSVLTFANFTGPADINPFPTPQAYNSRFICGKFCNYSSYVSPADGLFAESKIDGQVHFKGYGFSAQADWTASEHLKFTSITAYRDYTSIFSNEDDLSPLSHALGGPNSLQFHSFSEEVRLNGDLGNKAVEYTLGGFYEKQNIFYTSRQDIRYIPGGLVFVSGDPVPAFTHAAFANATWHTTDRLSFTGGLRYTEEGKDYTYRRRDRSGNLLAGQNALLDGQSGSYRGDRVDYRADAQYQFTDAVMAYVQYSTGFKGGGINPRPFAVQQVQPFGPETLETFEVGLKTELFDRTLRLNLAAFSSDYKDIQLILNSCPQFNPPGLPPGAAFPCGLPSNVGTARINGLEAEAAVHLQGLTLDSSVSYVDFKYRTIAPQAGGPGNPGGVQFGMVPPYTPKWKGSIGAQYEFPLGAAGSLTPRVDASYQDDMYGTAINSTRTLIKAYTLANARLTWRNGAGDLESSLEVTNVFDKYYYLTTFEVSAAAGVANAQPGRPREWAVTLKKKF
jgi:iron complex outermembrane receptor protein